MVNVAMVIATGVNNEGSARAWALTSSPPRTGRAGRLLASLVARGLSGVALVVSDDHKGLKTAIEAVLVGATWQRCRTHLPGTY